MIEDQEFDAVMNCLRGAAIDPLSRDEERELFQRYQQDGDIEARNRLIHANIRYAIQVARSFQNRVPLAEGVTIACMGLMTAVDRFDVSRGLKFISYAVWWIKQGLHDATANQNLVRRPTNQFNVFLRFHRQIVKLEQELGRNVSTEEVIEHMKLSGIQRDALLGLLAPVVSADRPAYEGRDRSKESLITFADVHLADPVGAEAMDEQLDQVIIADQLARQLERVLTPRERRIVGLYYGFAGNQPMTLEKIGGMLRLTRERVRQIKEKALEKLQREPSLKRLLRETRTGEYPPVRRRVLTREKIERAARMYSTSIEAAAALGCTPLGFRRACRRHGIEPPTTKEKLGRN